MQLVNGALRLYMRNQDGALESHTLRSIEDLMHPKFNDLDPGARYEAIGLLNQLTASPEYQADLEAAGQEMLRRQQERRANKRPIVVEVTPRS